MPEPEPMSQAEADAYMEKWYRPYKESRAEITFGQMDCCRAIASYRREKERADKAIADLAECFRLTGADPDGNEDWRLSERAVAEVAQLRKDSDDAPNWEINYATIKDLADELAEAVEKFIENDGCAAGGEAIPVCDALRAYRGINNDTST